MSQLLIGNNYLCEPGEYKDHIIHSLQSSQNALKASMASFPLLSGGRHTPWPGRMALQDLAPCCLHSGPTGLLLAAPASKPFLLFTPALPSARHAPHPSGLSSMSPLPERPSLTPWSLLASSEQTLSTLCGYHFVSCLSPQKEYTCHWGQKSMCLAHPSNRSTYNNAWEVAGA